MSNIVQIDPNTGRQKGKVQIKIGDKVVAHSQNLRGIIAYSNKCSVVSVTCSRRGAFEGTVQVRWSDGAVCVTDFADYSVLTQWCANRRNFPKGSTVTFDKETGRETGRVFDHGR